MAEFFTTTAGIGVIIVAGVVIDNYSLEMVHQNLTAEHPMLLDLLFPAALLFLFNNIFFGLGEIFHSNVWWSRAFAFRVDTAKKAYFTAGLLWLPIPIVTGFIALAAPTLGIFPPSADMVGPMVAANVLGYGGAILLFIIVFSALASSLDSLLAATSDLITQDIYNKHIKMFPGNLLAGMFNLTEMARYKADAGSEKAPDVDFDFKN